MRHQVIILRWSGSAYDSLGGILDLIGAELTAIGLIVRIVTVDHPDWVASLGAVLGEGDVAFALTMSGVGVDLMVDGKLIWEAHKVPLFNWSCDHPCYFPQRHTISSPYLLYGYVFPDHARYHINHLRPNGTAFAVHIGVPPRTLFPNAPFPLAQRNGRVVFTKSGADTNGMEANWRSFGPIVRDIVFSASEALFARETNAFLPVLQGVAERHGLFLDGASHLTLQIIRELDAYIRAKRADCVAKAVLRFPVDVYGSGWDHFDRNGSVAVFHGPVSWGAMIERLPHYTGCLSINPLVEESAHDRVFFALAAGVAPISDGNGFLRNHMPALAPYGFDFSSECIEQAVDTLLARPDEAIERTARTWDLAGSAFALRRSVRQIVQFVMLQSLNTRCGM